MKNHRTALGSDRGLSPGLSSIAKHFASCLLPLAIVCTGLPACAQPVPGTSGTTLPNSPLAVALAEWRALQQSESLPFANYARFLLNHPGWPGEAVLRKSAEKNLRADSEMPALVIAFCRRFPPVSASASLRLAEALQSQGDSEAARAAARQAWTLGVLSPEDEVRLLGRFASALSQSDQDQRMERLLWSRATAAATRQLLQTSIASRTRFEARLAFQTNAPDALLRSAQLDPSAQTDAGYVADRAFWLRASGQDGAVRAWLGTPRQYTAAPLDPARWLDLLEAVAESAARDGDWFAAMAIARQVGSTYPAGTDVRQRSFAERDSYTDITWLGGMAALHKAGHPDDAVRLFDQYARAARSTQGRAKGLYWAARAAESAGRRELAQSYYVAASEFVDQFYGQLATEKLGRALSLPVTNSTVSISGSEREAFAGSEIVRAAMMLGANGDWQDQTRFVRTIAASAKTPLEQALAAELGQRLGRNDLSLLVGRQAREDGNPDYLRAAFPMIRIPDDHAGSWTMIHAIARQESQFDREALSHAGARGLMQLMPATARQTAVAAGVPFDLPGLTRDAGYNVTLGSTYFGQLMDRFGGNYVLAIAAYNAGPGNVSKWLRTIGDPRQPGGDILAWIDAIPLSETRNYVQRVIENAVVYDLLNPRRAASRPVSLAAYLGMSQASYGAP